MEKARCVLDYFAPYLGRIEIMGGAGRIERVYFEIKQSNIDQWEKPQIKVINTHIRYYNNKVLTCSVYIGKKTIVCYGAYNHPFYVFRRPSRAVS